MKGFKPSEAVTNVVTDEAQEATEIIELASEQIDSLASAFELIASMLENADDERSCSQVSAEEIAASTLH